MRPISPRPKRASERGSPSHEPSAAAAISMRVTIPRIGRLSGTSVTTLTLFSSPRPTNAAPSAMPADVIAHASSAAIRMRANERMAVATAAMRRSCAPAKKTSHQPGGVGTTLPLARKNAYQTREPTNQDVAAQAPRSHIDLSSRGERAYAHQARKGTGKTTTLKIKLDVARGNPARVAAK